MKRNRRLFLRKTGLAAIAGCLGGCNSAAAPEAGEDAEGGAEQVLTIPLDSIFSTTGQKEPKPMNRAFYPQKDGSRKYKEPYGYHLDEVNREWRGGASNILLVRGKDITAAVKATRRAFTGSHSADVAVTADEDSKTAPLWAVAYFGTGSSTPSWLVQSVELKGTKIRISFSKAKLLQGAGDLHQYWVWVPLGHSKPGTYSLELFDRDRNDSTLVRRVTVSANSK